MSKKLGDIDYTKEEYLNLGANYENPPEGSNFAGKAELHIIDMNTNIMKNEELMMNNEKLHIDVGVASSCPSFEENYQEVDVEENQEEPIENTLIEAKFVANKIQELINSDYIVYDKKKGYRKITYKDIVILLRTTSNTAPIYEKELSELNIPVLVIVQVSH